jgi:hypothetical protein
VSVMKLPGDKTLASARTQPSVRADALIPSLPSPHPPLPPPLRTQSAVHADGLRLRRHKRRRSKFLFIYLFIYFVGSCCRLEKTEFFFGFWSPRSPRSPRSAGFASEAASRRRFFRPSSPSHPSKLYSSLGWLNSKVPKPFPPFSLRLIDVDGF